MIRGLSLTVLALILTASPLSGASEAQTGELEKRLETALGEVGGDFLGHEAVAVPEDGHPKKYLLLDFEGQQSARQQDRQQRIHSICMQILKNRDLVRDLSRDGFHMVSVAFNRRFQYDCL